MGLNFFSFNFLIFISICFIFGLKLKGIITMYGGANSHISIRCLEQNLPSCIGVGSSKYEDLRKAKYIELDCKSNLINIIS